MNLFVIGGLGTPPSSLWDLAGSLELVIGQKAVRLAWTDRPGPIEGDSFVCLHSHGIEAFRWMYSRNMSTRFHAALIDPVLRASWLTPRRPDIFLPANVRTARCWSRGAWLPPYSSDIDDVSPGETRNYWVGTGHNRIVWAVAEDVLEYATEVMAA